MAMGWPKGSRVAWEYKESPLVSLVPVVQGTCNGKTHEPVHGHVGVVALTFVDTFEAHMAFVAGLPGASVSETKLCS